MRASSAPDSHKRIVGASTLSTLRRFYASCDRRTSSAATTNGDGLIYARREASLFGHFSLSLPPEQPSDDGA
jgi:hypothetical protein